MDSNKKLKQDQAFEKGRKQAVAEYNDELIGLINDACTSLKDGETRVIYLDKNHPPEGGIKAAVAMIDRYMSDHIPYCKLHLIPQIENDKIPKYPFSYEFVAQSMYNGLQRNDHPTLDNKDLPKLFGI